MIDTHCHLTYPGLDEIKEKVLKEARDIMDVIITCGYPKDKEKAIKLYEENKGFIYLTLGLHPVDALKMSDKEIEEYKQFIINNRDKIIGLGEIGLDYHWIKDEKKNERARKIFIDFLKLSEELNLPAILHTRKAEEDCFNIVKKLGMKRVLFHYYTGNLTTAKKVIKQGYYISLGTLLTRSKNTKKIAKKYPLTQLFTETDSPFNSPYPGQVNVPQNVKLILKKMSKLRNRSVEEIDEVIMKNAKTFFKI
jgi:TatD DNase family protein